MAKGLPCSLASCILQDGKEAEVLPACALGGEWVASPCLLALTAWHLAKQEGGPDPGQKQQRHVSVNSAVQWWLLAKCFPLIQPAFPVTERMFQVTLHIGPQGPGMDNLRVDDPGLSRCHCRVPSLPTRSNLQPHMGLEQTASRIPGSWVLSACPPGRGP